MSVTKDLSIYLPLDSITINNGENDQTVDKSGNANDIDLFGNVSLIEDATFGYVCDFPGNSDYLYYPVWDSGNFNGAFDLGEKTYAVTAWVKPRLLNESNPVFAISSPANQGAETEILLSIDSTGRLFVQIDAITSAVPTQADIADLDVNRWHFIALVMYQNQLTLRHNSAITQLTLENNNGFERPANAEISIGACLADGSSFNGSMANVRIYKSELTSTDLDEIVNADLANELQISLPLDAIVGGKLIDVSGNGYDGTVECSVNFLTVVTDPVFGSVVNFSNAEPVDIRLSNPHYEHSAQITSLTAQMWIRTTDTGEMQLLDYSDKYYQLSLGTHNGIDGLICWTTRDRTDVLDVLYSTQPVNDGEWHFISVVYEAGLGAKLIYIDGVLSSDPNYIAHLKQPLGYATNGTVYEGCIGRIQNTTDKMYNGDMSQASIFHRALSQEAILQSMGRAAVATASFYSVFPLGFELVDGEEINTLFISDQPADNEVSLFLANISDQVIVFAATNGVSESSFQLQLVFRPGTLSQASLAEMSLKNEDDWYFLVGAALPDGSVPLYLSAKNETTVYPLENLPFTVLNLTAEAAGGTRSTRVQLNYQQLTFLGQTTPVIGQREITINIMNRQGKQNIPLIVGFSGTNQVVINKSNNIAFRITNSLSSDTSYDQHESNAISLIANTERTTSFVLSFEGWDENEISDGENGKKSDSSWDLNSYQKLAQISAVTFNSVLSDVGEADDWEVEFFKEGEKPFWRISPRVDVILNPRDSIVFNVEGLVPIEPASHSHMYIDYQNVPGYWDGQFMLLLEKGLLKQEGSFVGIGLEDAPQLPLSIGKPQTGIGQESTSLNFYSGGTDSNHVRLSLREDGEVNMGTPSVPANLSVNGGGILLKAADSNSLSSVSWTTSANHYANIQYFSGEGSNLGKLTLQTYGTNHNVNTPVSAVAIQDDGKVLVGDNGNSPQSQLTVDPGDVSLRRNGGNAQALKFTDEGNNVKSSVASSNVDNTEQLSMSMGNADPSKPKLVLKDSDTPLSLQAPNAALLVDGTNGGSESESCGTLKIRGDKDSNSVASIDFENLSGATVGNETIASIQAEKGNSGDMTGALSVKVRYGNSMLQPLTIQNNGKVGIGNSPDSSAQLRVDGDVKITGNIAYVEDVVYSGVLRPTTTKPFYVKRFTGIDGGDDKDTGVRASGCVAIIAGFFAADGDIDEKGQKAIDLQVIMKIRESSNGHDNWFIDAEMASHNHNETFTVDVLFMDTNLVDDQRNLVPEGR